MLFRSDISITSTSGALPTLNCEIAVNDRIVQQQGFNTCPKKMIKCANSLLRLTISLLLVFCAHPISKECAQDTVQSFTNSSSMAYFAPAILESTFATVSSTSKEGYNSSDKSFQYALILHQILLNSTQPLFSIHFNDIDYFANKIWQIGRAHV